MYTFMAVLSHCRIVPSNAAGYPQRLCWFSTFYTVLSTKLFTDKVGKTGIVVLDVINHGKEAEWTSELQQDVFTFEVHVSLSACPEWISNSGVHNLWYATVFWLDFIFWVEQHVRISRLSGCSYDGVLMIQFPSTFYH
jgi:hypothetical protein